MKLAALHPKNPGRLMLALAIFKALLIAGGCFLLVGISIAGWAGFDFFKDGRRSRHGVRP